MRLNLNKIYVSRASTFGCLKKGDPPQYTFFVKKVSSDGLVVFLARKTSLRLSIPYESDIGHFLWFPKNASLILCPQKGSNLRPSA